MFLRQNVHIELCFQRISSLCCICWEYVQREKENGCRMLLEVETSDILLLLIYNVKVLFDFTRISFYTFKCRIEGYTSLLKVEKVHNKEHVIENRKNNRFPLKG